MIIKIYNYFVMLVVLLGVFTVLGSCDPEIALISDMVNISLMGFFMVIAGSLLYIEE
jgi:hypothetical protein